MVLNRQSAEQGNTDAQWELGECYRCGVGAHESYEDAIFWFKAAADQGDVDAQLSLGNMYYRGEAGGYDTAEAVKWFRTAAEQGNAEAQFNLGDIYSDAYSGVCQDLSEAAKWYQMAAKNGIKQAKENLKSVNFKIELIKEKEAEVAALKARAVEGDADRQYELARKYLRGHGVQQDLEEASKILRKAAGQGHLKAQYLLTKSHVYPQCSPDEQERTETWTSLDSETPRTLKMRLVRTPRG